MNKMLQKLKEYGNLPVMDSVEPIENPNWLGDAMAERYRQSLSDFVNIYKNSVVDYAVIFDDPDPRHVDVSNNTFSVDIDA